MVVHGRWQNRTSANVKTGEVADRVPYRRYLALWSAELARVVTHANRHTGHQDDTASSSSRGAQICKESCMQTMQLKQT